MHTASALLSLYPCVLFSRGLTVNCNALQLWLYRSTVYLPKVRIICGEGDLLNPWVAVLCSRAHSNSSVTFGSKTN